MKQSVKRLASLVLTLALSLSLFTANVWAAEAPTDGIASCQRTEASASALNAEAPLKLQSATLSGSCGKNLTWTLDSKGTLTISGKGAMYNFDYEEYNCPWDNYRESIKKIVIKKGVTTIGELAFCETMWKKGSSISIPNTVTSIGLGAFEGTGLKGTVNIPGSVKTLGSYLFHMSEGPKVKLHEGLQTIKAYALIDISNKSLTIPSTVKSIGEGAFASNVKKIIFKGNAPKFHKKAFTWNDDEDDHPMKLTVYYPKGNKTWKSVIKKQYGGKIKWVAKKM